MPKNELPEHVNQIIARGIAASMTTAIEEAQRYHLPLIVWRDGKIVEVPPESLVAEQKTPQ